MLNNLRLIGTTHLTPSSEIERIIKLEKPDLIGIELCQTRVNVLILNPPIQEQKEDTSLIGKISKAIKNKAKEQKLNYGSDMISAYKLAEQYKIPSFLVDRDIIEIKNLLEKIPQNEMIGFMKEIAEFESKQNIEEELKNINEEEVLNKLKTNYPVSYELLIVSRELYITNQILKQLINNPNKKILVFLGKGHIKGINKLLGFNI